MPWLNDIDTVVFDCDGVLWRSGVVIPGAMDTVNELYTSGKRVVFVTNNSALSRAQYAEKLRKLGVLWCLEAHVLSSSYSAAAYLKNRQFKGRALVLGSNGIVDELGKVGISSQLAQDASDGLSIPEIAMAGGGFSAVVIGLDHDFNYRRVAMAAAVLHANSDALFVATNRDETFVSSTGALLPGTGAGVAAVACASMREPVDVGKPSQYLADALCLSDPSRALMVGDRLSTDISFGAQAGMRTMLVLTGVDTRSSVESALIKPDFILESVADIL